MWTLVRVVDRDVDPRRHFEEEGVHGDVDVRKGSTVELEMGEIREHEGVEERTNSVHDAGIGKENNVEGSVIYFTTARDGATAVRKKF
ncbi:hypothetical protein Hanom_Chr08g00745871 [Helianthus anomalus]